MKLTSEPAEHLTFGGSHGSPTFRILSIDRAFELSRVHAIKTTLYLTHALEVRLISDLKNGRNPVVLQGISLTYVLLFGRNAPSAQIAISKAELSQDPVQLLRESYLKEPNILSLQTFVVYGTRFQKIQDALEK